MKTIYKYIFAAFAGVSLTSGCNFLEENPTSTLVKDNVYVSEAAARTALLGCYSTLADLTNQAYLQFVHGASILRVNIQSDQPDSWSNHTLYSTDTRNLSAYQAMFSGISTINSFLDGIAASNIPENVVRQFSAEARLLRAYFYFNGVRLWGDLPLFLSQPVDIAAASKPRTRYQDIYKAILDDLDYAEKNLGNYEQLGAQAVKEGRFCNFTATALKAKVYLQMASYAASPDDQWFDTSKEGRYPDFSNCGFSGKDASQIWRKALECAEKVINEGPFDLEPDYANLFRFEPEEHPEDYLSKERIIVIPMTTQSVKSYYSSYSLPKNPWGANDAANNGNKLRCRPSRFTWEKWCEKYGGTEYCRGGEQPDLGTYNYYSGCPDPRLDATYFYHTYYTGKPGSNRSTVRCYPYPGNDELSANNYVAMSPSTDIASTSGAGLQNGFAVYKKGFSKSYAGNNTGGDADIYLMRYADVLLIAAEAAASLSTSLSDANAQKAIAYVNTLLTRARRSTNVNAAYPHEYDGVSEAASPAAWKAADYSDVEDLIDAIMWERVFEMDYEFQTFFDTRRRGANFYVEHFVHPFNVFRSEAANTRLFNCPVFRGIDKQEDISLVRAGLLLAFPDQELRYNTALGYGAQNDFIIQ